MFINYNLNLIRSILLIWLVKYYPLLPLLPFNDAIKLDSII